MKKLIITILLMFQAQTLFSAVLFDSLNDIIDCGSKASLDNMNTSGTGITISAWINPASVGEGSFGCIVGKLNAFPDAGMWLLQVNTSNNLRFAKDFTTANLLFISSNGVFSLNKWQHVLATWDGTNLQSGVKIYVNGISVPDSGTGTNGSGTIRSDESLNFNIGNFGDTTRTFDGQITEVAVWNKVLPQQQITLLASSRVKYTPLQVSPSSLRGYWPLDSISRANSFVADRSMFSNNGVDGGGPVVSPEQILSYP